MDRAGRSARPDPAPRRPPPPVPDRPGRGGRPRGLDRFEGIPSPLEGQDLARYRLVVLDELGRGRRSLPEGFLARLAAWVRRGGRLLVCRGWNRVRAKTGARALAIVYADPLIVAGTAGRGRTAVLLAGFGRGWARELRRWPDPVILRVHPGGEPGDRPARTRRIRHEGVLVVAEQPAQGLLEVEAQGEGRLGEGKTIVPALPFRALKEDCNRVRPRFARPDERIK